MEEKDVFQEIDYSNKVEPIPYPDRVRDIDVNNNIYDNIIDAQDKGTLDMSAIQSFTSISRSRDQVYALLDTMAEDPIISSALEIYSSDITEPNDQGKIIWAESKDEKISNAVTQILDSLNADKNLYAQAYSLCKYGDLYLRLYRKSEFDEEAKKEVQKLNESISDEEKKKLMEAVILKIYSKNDRYADYAEQEKNPANVFDLIRFGKTCGFIKTDIPAQKKQDTTMPVAANTWSQFRYSFKSEDVDIYGATEFVHASLDDNSDRIEEKFSLTGDDDKEIDGMSFDVKRGKSILYDCFKTWRELSLLENSVLLNRVTRSSLIRTLNIEIGDMGKTEAQALMRRIKQMVEQKTAYSLNNSMQDYTNPGPAENILYFPTHNNVGTVTPGQIGGDGSDVGDLNDLDYWKKKLFASLGIPGQYIGDTDDSTGFNGGTSLSLISSKYAKRIKRIQNALIQMYTDAVNLILLDRGLKDYINKFEIHMQAPTTQEEKDREENMSNAINQVREIMGLLDNIEDTKTRLEILKSLLSNVITNTEVLGYIQEEIDKLEKTPELEESELLDGGEGSDELDLDMDFGGGGGSDLDLPDMGDLGGEEELGSEPLDLGTETTEEEPPAESFYNGTGEPLNEKNDLPSFAQLGVSFTDVR